MAIQISLNAENVKMFVERYSKNIALMGTEIFGFERFDPWQLDLFNAVTNQDIKKIAIAAAHGVGKTLTGSLIALHRLLCYIEPRVTITSATESQLKSAFTTTIQMLIDRSSVKDWLNVSAESITLKSVTGSWIALRAWSKSKPESIAGVHCVSPLYIIDEASGVDDTVHEAIQGSMGHPYSKIILFGNPLRRSGELYDAFHKKADFFYKMNISALDSSFTSKHWIEEMKSTYGEDSDIYRIRVMGLFGISDVNAFIPEPLLEAAAARTNIINPLDPVVAGIDVGMHRDATVICIRQGSKVHLIKQWYSRDPYFLLNEISQLIIKWNVATAVIDANGVGAGLASMLKRDHGNIIQFVRFAQLPHTEKMYTNTRTKYWGLAKEWLEYGDIPDNRELITQGSTPLYTYDKLGRFMLEQKKDLASSPDLFDGFAYTFGVNVRSKTVRPEMVRDQVDEIIWS